MKIISILFALQLSFGQISYSREEFSIVNPSIWHISFYNKASINKDMFFILFELSMFQMKNTTFLVNGLTTEDLAKRDIPYLASLFNGVYLDKGYLFQGERKLIRDKEYVFLYDEKKEVLIYGREEKGKTYFIFFHKKYSITDQNYYDMVVSTLEIH